MKKTPFILKELSIHKIPGFPRGLDTFENLAAEINIVAGPNASGKSSTARIIQQLIWHNRTKGLDIEGSVEIDGEPWEIKIDSDNIKIQRDGKDDDLTGLPAVEECNRYMLALHELVKEDEDDLARQIVKESIGGYDLDLAQENLGYLSAIKNKAASEFKNFIRAENKYKEIRNKQRELKKEEESLNQLYEAKEHSQQASKLKGLYEKVVGYLEAKLKFDQLSEKFKDFPGALEKVTDEEYTTIEDLEKEIEDAEYAIEQANTEIKKSKEVLTSLEIPEEGIGEKVLNELEHRVERLNELDREIKETEKKIKKFQAEELEALRSIDESIDPSEWNGLNLDEVRNLDKFLQDANQVLGEKEFLLAEIDALKKEIENADSGISTPENLSQGIKTLSHWLHEQKSITGIAKWIIVASSIIGIGTAITSFFAGWPGLLGIALIVGLLVYAYLFDNKKHKETTYTLREQDFIETGLTPPSRWDIESVSEKLDELVEKLKTAKWQEKINQRINSCTDNLDSLQSRLNQINKFRDEWAEKLKAAPGFPSENSKDFSGLYWFLKHVKDWQNTHTELEALKAQKIQLQEQYDEELDKANERFVKSNAGKAKDAVEAKAIFNQLKKDETARQGEVQEIMQKEEQIKERERQKKKASDKLQKIYEKLDVENGEKEKVRQLVEQLEEYKRISKEHYAANEGLSEKEPLLKNHSLYEEYEQAIEGLSIDQAQGKVEEMAREANKLEGINEEITRIETLIQSKKTGHELEDTLAEKEETLNNLEQLYESNLSSLTGKLIIDQLRRETREQNRPKVFKRANELLSRITNGRYELRLEEKDEPAFKAYDTVLRLGQDLTEISTGTRVQLLLSIRLAFVETQESTIKLPLLADELLANSDDERAKAIIESFIEISREGRQIFYFTAQADEVGKWNSFLKKEPNLSYKVIRLTSGKKSPVIHMDYQSDFESFNFIQQVPSPDEKSYQDYGKEIQAEQFNILIQDCSQLHLWYLMNDSALLHSCLKKGIRYWGQLDSFLRNNGKIEKTDESLILHVNERIKLLERFQELYRRGRPRPINSEVLEHSGAVSGSFINDVSAKLMELRGNPKKLIRTLRDGEISGFRQSKIDELEQFLSNEQYLDNQEPLEKEEILVQLNAIISNMDMDISDAESFINRILQPNHIVDAKVTEG